MVDDCCHLDPQTISEDRERNTKQQDRLKAKQLKSENGKKTTTSE
jgi:hypothetical protein